MNVLIYKQLEREILELDFEIDVVAEEIINADTDDDDLDINALHERRKTLERRRTHLQMRILDLIR